MGRVCSGFGYRKGTRVTIYKRAWQVGFWPPAERLKDFRVLVCLDRRQGEPACQWCPKRGKKAKKMTFSNFPLIWRFREVLMVSYQDEKQEKIDCFFLLLYNKKTMPKKQLLEIFTKWISFVSWEKRLSHIKHRCIFCKKKIWKYVFSVLRILKTQLYQSFAWRQDLRSRHCVGCVGCVYQHIKK